MAPSLRPEHLLAAIFSFAQDALLAFGLDGTLHHWSKGAERLYGYTEAEMNGKPLSQLLPPQDVPHYHQLLARLRQGCTGTNEFSDRLHKNGSTLRVAVTHSMVRNETGEIVAFVESGKRALATSSILKAKPNSSASADPEARRHNNHADDVPLQSMLAQMPVFLWTTDSNLRITSNWGSGMQLAKVTPGELIGRTAYDFLKCPDLHASALDRYTLALGGNSSRFEFRLRNRDFEVRLQPLRDSNGSIVGCVGAGMDVTERKRDEEEYRYQATHDALTGLANYREFLDALEREVRRAERSNHSFAVLLLDLDDLKRINDRWGHLTGNRALRRLAEVMKEQCRSTDLAARYGGDEFAVLLIDADPSMARQVAYRVENALDKDREEPRLRVSIGASVYPDHGRTARELLEAADQELYRRKKGAHSQIVSAR